MRMRVALVRALATHPQLLLLDEPFGALDEITRQRLNEELLDLWLRQGWTGIFVTHNVFEAVFLSQRILVLGARPGRVVAEIAIPLPFPRTPEVRGTPEFARLAGEVSGWLRRSSG
jgi:NitT/TauT family transport system ATP-binding protein